MCSLLLCWLPGSSSNLPLAFHPLSRVRQPRVARLPHLSEEAGKSATSRRGAAEKVAPFSNAHKRLNLHAPLNKQTKAHHIPSGVSTQPRTPTWNNLMGELGMNVDAFVGPITHFP